MIDTEIFESLLNECKNSEDQLVQIADQLDRWAKESRQGGWSTHQVEPMRALANQIRAYPERRKLIKRCAAITG